MEFSLSIYGINKSKQRDLQWYLDQERYKKEDNHLFELYFNTPKELYKTLKFKSKVPHDDIIVIDNETLRDLMIDDLKEDNFYYDLSYYHALMSEIYKIDRVKNDFYIFLHVSF
ncbi:hypothetical protein [Staphylococcus phage LY01]|nr:hypothetical protein [Staphylococcus phage LY01]